MKRLFPKWSKSLAPSCGTAGYYAQKIECYISGQPTLHKSYVQNLFTCVFTTEALQKSQTLVEQDVNTLKTVAASLHRKLTGQLSHGGLAGNAAIRLRAGAQTILGSIENKDDVLKTIGLSPERLAQFKDNVPQRESSWKQIRDWFAMTGLRGSDRKTRAHQDDQGRTFLVQNGNAHFSLSHAKDDSVLDLTPTQPQPILLKPDYFRF